MMSVGVFYEYIGKYFNKVATGHYAQIAMTTDGVARLLMSPDPVKDQSYFLSNLSQEQLRRCLFPIGHLEKSQVRVLAESFDLPTKTRKDSQGICFLGKLKFDDFIGHYLGQQPGPIKCYRTGRELGRHRGLWFHTIGQRKGLGLLLSGVVHEGPWFVADKHPASNTLLVTNDLSGIDRPRRIFLMDRINWIRELPVGLDTSEGVSLLLKLRHGPTLSRGTVRLVKGDHDDDKDERSGNNKLLLEVQLDRADKGIAPGQFAALYQDGECLGAGVVTETLRDDDAPSPSSLDEVVTGEVLFKQSRVLSF
jgi:tRNA (5-methylaminomethyl-2-thiouridylate)-methyltransferase